ncbi:MAG TPA: ABC transporter permease, partial [Blastocatellia bacterium]|nr:ABC transporter permease [Blastocatellia bacterium]
MGQLSHDLKFAVRVLIRKPVFTACGVLILAIGIGATTAIFSVVNGVLLRPLPYPNSGRIVKLWESFATGGFGTVSPPNLADWRAQNRTFESLAAYDPGSRSLRAGQLPVQVPAAFVTGDFFDVLGSQPAEGRLIQPGEDQPGRDHEVVISDRLWRTSFGADPGIVGQNISLNGESYAVIGIARPDMTYPSRNTDIWAPMVITPKQMSMRGNHSLFVLGLLKPGVALSAAQADMSAIGNRLEQAYPDDQAGRNVILIDLKEEMVKFVRPALLIVLGAVFFVLLIVCANIANLQLARAVGRQKEIAIRGALGAGAWRLARQFITESLLLALSGGLLGIAVAIALLKLLLTLADTVVPRSTEVTLDLRVLGVATGLTIITGLVFGLAPALYSARIGKHDALKEGGRSSGSSGHRRVYAWLIGSETALALVLLAGAGLMVKSFLALEHTDTGLKPDNILTLRMSLPEPRYPNNDSIARFFKQARERIAVLPGVKSAAFITFIPLQRWGWNSGFSIEGREPFTPGLQPFAERRAITPAYFDAMGIPVLEGRAITDQDTKDSLPVVVINQAFAKYFPDGKDPIGGRVLIDETWRTVIGVVGDVRQSGLYESPRPESFTPYTQEQDRGLLESMSLAVKTAARPESLTGSIREQITAIDPGQPIYDVQTMESIIAGSISSSRLNSILLGLFAGIAMILAVIGIYGVVSFWAAQRTREIGVRVALGASRGQVVSMMIKRGMTPVI